MKIAVLQFFNTPYRELAAITVPPVADYCRRHGYTHIVERVQARTDGAHMCWYKPELLMHHLPNYDWVLYIDCDATITNHDIELTNFMTDSPVSVACDANGINCGVMLMRSAPEVLAMLQRMLATPDKYTQLSEQNAFICEAKDVDVATSSQRSFNSCLYGLYGGQYNYPKGEWQPSDFVLHLPGVDMKTRIQTFNAVQHGLPLT